MFFVDGVPATSISISSLAAQNAQSTYVPLNASALIEYNKKLNSQAQIRDYLMPFMSNLIIAASSSIILQATSFVQLTQATNQLTRTATVTRNSFYNFSMFSPKLNYYSCWHPINVIN